MGNWIWLLTAIGFEAAWVVGLRYTESWSRLWPSLAVVVIYSLGLLPYSLAGRTIAPSVLYSIWVGGSIVLVFLVDAIFFNEPVSLPKLACVALILTGAIGLRFLTVSGP